MKTGWDEKPFEDCLAKVTYTTKVQRKDFLDAGRFPIVSQEEDFISGYWDREADAFKVETPVVLFGDHTRVVKYVDFDFVLGADGVKILQPKAFLFPKFFYYQLQAAEVAPLGYARHYRLLKELRISYPGLPEQQRIVRILDEAFDGIATAKANGEKNLQNARALFDSYISSVFEPDGHLWPEKALGDLCEILDSRRVPVTKRDRHSGEIPYYGATGVQDYVRDFLFDEPLVLVGEDGAKWGAGERTAYAISGKSWVNNHAHVLRPNRALLTDDWLIYFLNASDLSRFVSGLTVQKLTQGNMRDIPIPVPPIADQTRTTKAAREVESELKRLASHYERKIAALDELKRSLLQQAFTGRL